MFSVPPIFAFGSGFVLASPASDRPLLLLELLLELPPLLAELLLELLPPQAATAIAQASANARPSVNRKRRIYLYSSM